MILTIVLLMLALSANFATHLISGMVVGNKNMANFRAYAERMHEAELQLIKQESLLNEKLQQTELAPSNAVLEMKKNLPSTIKLIGFVPDHLEFSCQEGVFIFQVESSMLQTYWAARVY